MRRHPTWAAKAGISAARYEELKCFCRQYREYKQAITRARAGIVDRPAPTSGAWHAPDPTGRAAMHLADHPAARRVKIIEDCAAAVAEPAVAGALLKSVTEGTGYDALRPPVRDKTFYAIRRAFFMELDRRLWDA